MEERGQLSHLAFLRFPRSRVAVLHLYPPVRIDPVAGMVVKRPHIVLEAPVVPLRPGLRHSSYSTVDQPCVHSRAPHFTETLVDNESVRNSSHDRLHTDIQASSW